MTVAELLHTARFLVDAAGKKTAVVLDVEAWEEILTLLEDLEDADELRRLHETDEEVISWDDAKQALRARGLNV